MICWHEETKNAKSWVYESWNDDCESVLKWVSLQFEMKSYLKQDWFRLIKKLTTLLSGHWAKIIDRGDSNPNVFSFLVKFIKPGLPIASNFREYGALWNRTWSSIDIPPVHMYVAVSTRNDKIIWENSRDWNPFFLISYKFLSKFSFSSSFERKSPSQTNKILILQ